MFKDFLSKYTTIHTQNDRFFPVEITIKLFVGKTFDKTAIKKTITMRDKKLIFITLMSDKGECQHYDYNDGELSWHINDKIIIKNLSENLFIPINELELTVRASNALREANFIFLGDILTDYHLTNEEGWLKGLLVNNFGNKSHKNLVDALNKIGIFCRIDFDRALYLAMREEKLSKNNI